MNVFDDKVAAYDVIRSKLDSIKAECLARITEIEKEILVLRSKLKALEELESTPEKEDV